MSKLKILQLCKKFPYPIKDGEVIGIINLTIGFHFHGNSTTVLALNTLKHFFEPDQLPTDISKIAIFKAQTIDTSINIKDAFLNLFTQQSYNVERFYSSDYEASIYNEIVNGDFDVVLLEGIYLMRYIRCIRKAIAARKPGMKIPVVIQRPQNVEFVIWERLAKSENNPFKKIYLRFLAKRMKQFEINHINQADVLIPVSQVDLDIFKTHGCTLPSTAIPTGYVFDTLSEIDVDKEKKAVAFIGGMDWMPNKDGVNWFLNEVWPIIIRAQPDAEFYLAGRNFPESLYSLKAKGVKVLGEVEDAKAFVKSYSISIVPLFAGSGMRVKIIEAMAWGRAVVSTSVGAESIAYTKDKDIKIADTAQEFADAIIALLTNESLRKRMGENAQELIKSTYDNKLIAQKILDFAITNGNQ